METLNGSLAEVAKSFLVITVMIWIVYRIFILTKHILRGWGKKEDK